MVDFIAFAVLINLLMSALIYTIRHSIPIRTPVLIIASLMSILFCSMYPYLASFFVFPKVLYIYALLVLTGAVLLYFIERTFFVPEALVVSEPLVVEALTVMETPSKAPSEDLLLQTSPDKEMVIETVFIPEKDIPAECGIAELHGEELDKIILADVHPGFAGTPILFPIQSVELTELCTAADEVSGYVPEYAVEDIAKDIYEETEKIAADIEKEILFVLENEYNRNMEDVVEEAAAAIFYEQNNSTDTLNHAGDFSFYSPLGNVGEINSVVALTEGVGPDEYMEENAGESKEAEKIPLNEGYHLEKEQPQILTAGEEVSTAGALSVNGLVEVAFDKKSAGDLPAAVEIFMHVLKLSPPPRLAMLVCLEMGAIYRDIGQREQAVAALEMFLARWGSNFSTDVAKVILSSIKELKGESQ